MIKYIGGESVKMNMIGFYMPATTYICVLEEPDDKTIEEGFLALEQYVTNELGLIIKQIIPNRYTVIVENNDEYTLAHEIKYDDKSPYPVKCQPSNILRHMNSRPFTMDTLYMDEQGQLVELINCAKDDIGRMYYRNQSPFYPMVYNYPEIIVDVLHGKITQHCRYSDDIESTFYRSMRNVKAFINEGKTKAKLTELFHKDYFMTTTNHIRDYEGLRYYLTNNCGLSLQPMVEPPPHIIMEDDSGYFRDPQFKMKKPVVKPKKAEPLKWGGFEAAMPGIQKAQFKVKLNKDGFIDNPIEELRRGAVMPDPDPLGLREEDLLQKLKKEPEDPFAFVRDAVMDFRKFGIENNADKLNFIQNQRDNIADGLDDGLYGGKDIDGAIKMMDLLDEKENEIRQNIADAGRW